VTVHRANTIDWPNGALVIHDRDEKAQRMVRIVIGVRYDGKIRTRYAHPHLLPPIWRKRIMHDRRETLHHPWRFRLSCKKSIAA